MSTGVAMLMKSMGIDPQAMQQQIGAVVGAAQNADQRIAALQADVREMNHKLDLIMVHLGISPMVLLNG